MDNHFTQDSLEILSGMKPVRGLKKVSDLYELSQSSSPEEQDGVLA